MPPPAPPFPRGSGGCVLYPGTKVLLHSCKASAELNGQEATCENWDALSGRMQVRLQDGKVKSLKPINMKKIIIPDSDDEDSEDEEDPMLDRVLKVFQQYDTNGDGIIDCQEFERCLKSLGLARSCMSSFLESVDKSGDMEIQYEEFVNWAMAPASKRTKKSRLDVFWPEKTATDAIVDIVDEDDDEPVDESKELTLEDVEKICGELPEGWPSHGVTVLNNMRARFPDYPVEGIVWRMRRNDFIGGKVISAIRATGAREVETVPPSAVKVGKPGAFPHKYRVRSMVKPLKVYKQGGKNWSFQNMRDEKLTPVGEIPPADHFEVLEVKRGNEYGFCFGRIKYVDADDPKATYWAVLGLEVNRSHWSKGDGARSTSIDLNYSDAARIE